MRVFLALLAFASVARADQISAPPAGFVELRSVVPGVRLDIRYGTANNFTGAPLPGYGAEGAWLLAPVAKALAEVATELAKQDLGLLVYDAYRPARATRQMVVWATRAGRTDLLDDGYVARKSGHNHGHTIDITLVKLSDGTPIDMGTPWDAFDERSHTERATGEALAHRHVLRDAMVAHGFKPYAKEWWHFTFPSGGTRARDVPYGCHETPEDRAKPSPACPAP